MQNTALEKYAIILKELENDAEYQKLKKECCACEEKLREVLSALTEEQRESIIEYIGICSEMELRALEIACYIL